MPGRTTIRYRPVRAASALLSWSSLRSNPSARMIRPRSVKISQGRDGTPQADFLFSKSVGADDPVLARPNQPEEKKRWSSFPLLLSRLSAAARASARIPFLVQTQGFASLQGPAYRNRLPRRCSFSKGTSLGRLSHPHRRYARKKPVRGTRKRRPRRAFLCPLSASPNHGHPCDAATSRILGPGSRRGALRKKRS